MSDEIIPYASGGMVRSSAESSTLLGRGLLSIKSGAYGLNADARAALYEDARKTYNVLTDDGRITFFGNVGIDQNELNRLHKVFQDLADVGYGKAYWPLAIFYEGGKGTPGDAEKAWRYNKLAFDWCYQNQQEKDPEIWTDLADQYLRGKRRPHLFHIPEQLRVEACDANLSEAQDGDGVSDTERALFWYRKAADVNYPPACFQLSEMYWDGTGVNEDHDEAIRWQLMAAEAGHAQAQYGLAVQHSTWISTQPTSSLLNTDEEIALQWLLKSASQGHVKAVASLNRLGNDSLAELKARELEADKIGVSWKIDSSTAEDMLAIAMGSSGGSVQYLKERDRMYRAARDKFDVITDDGNKHFDEEPYCFPVSELEACRADLQDLADDGYGPAFLPLYHLYSGGFGVIESPDLAREYFERAWEWCFHRQLELNASIWNDLGTLCRIRDGLAKFVRGEFRVVEGTVVHATDDQVHYLCKEPQNRMHESAHVWYRQAAEHGNASAMNNLCRLYESGAHYANRFDRRLALCWQLAAAESGNSNAQYAIALKSIFGAKTIEGRSYVLEDEKIGLQWMTIASLAGNCYATSFLSDMLTTEEISERKRSVLPAASVGVRWDLDGSEVQHFRQVSRRLSDIGQNWGER